MASKKVQAITSKQGKIPQGYKPTTAKLPSGGGSDKITQPKKTGARALPGVANKKMSVKGMPSYTSLLTYTSPGAGTGKSAKKIDSRVGVGKLGSTR